MSEAEPSLFDTHCHLDFEAFDSDRDAVVDRARAAGVERIVVPGVRPDQWSSLAVLAERYREVSVAVGIHPQVLPELQEGQLEVGLAGLEDAAREVGAIAIGECGLDGPTVEAGASYELQERVLRRHLEAADALGLPVILHVYRAHGRALDLLEAHGPLRGGGIVHSYSGSAELVQRYVDLSLFISFAGAVTRSSARRPKAAARVVPRERLLIETDAPDQSPTGAGTARNEPAHVVHTLRALADLLGMEERQLAIITSNNARAAYGLTRRLA